MAHLAVVGCLIVIDLDSVPVRLENYITSSPFRHGRSAVWPLRGLPSRLGRVKPLSFSTMPTSFLRRLLAADQKIPRVIHQTGPVRYRDLPSEFKQNIKALKALHPGWKYRYYDNDDCRRFILKHCGKKPLLAYDRINPRYGAARADLFRYIVMLKIGGVYLDLKSQATIPLDRVLRWDDQYILSQWHDGMGRDYAGWGSWDELRHVEGGEYQQWHIISIPGHPFLKAVLKRVLKNIFEYCPRFHGVGRLGVLRTTGPVPYTIAIQRRMKRHPCRLVKIDKDFGLSYTFMERPFSHRDVLGSHYSRLDLPVVTSAS